MKQFDPKPFLLGVLLTTTLYCIQFFLFQNALDLSKIRFGALSVLLFFYLATLFILVINEVLIHFAPAQVAYAFLFSVLIKIGAFMMFFSSSIVVLENKTYTELIVLILPLFVFLFAEVLLLAKRLKTVE
jgi:hypothetical protein